MFCNYNNLVFRENDLQRINQAAGKAFSTAKFIDVVFYVDRISHQEHIITEKDRISKLD